MATLGIPDEAEHQQQLLEQSEASLQQFQAVNVSPASERFTVLARIPDDIQAWREQVFSLDTPITMDGATWEKYWAFVDNIWCLHNRHDAPEGLAKGMSEKFWGGCRLQRKWDHGSSTPSPKGIRNRSKRATGTCPAKFKLTINPDGTRYLERSTKEGHSHDLDHIDAIKRNSGVRSLVLDPFFNSWEPASIMAYLRDPSHFVNARDMLNEAGGKYLERREIMNIFSQNLRKLYPGLDISVVKKEQEKYKQVKMCNFKGCNQAFTDAKALAAHRKAAHSQNRHDHSHRMYTCPEKGCHRKKKSKGFMTMIALREHQIKLQHYGSGTFFSDDGANPCLPVTETDTMDDLRAEEDQQDQNATLGAIEGDAVQALSSLPQASALGVNLQSPAGFGSPLPPSGIIPGQQTSDMRLVSSLLNHSPAVLNPHNDPSAFLAIDPAMQSQSTTAAQAASALETLSESLSQFNSNATKEALLTRFRDLEREKEVMDREREAMEREIEAVKEALISSS